MTDTLETHRGVVQPHETDHAGRLTMAAYARRFDEATWHFLAHLGVTPPHLREAWRDVVVREQRVTHHAEVPAGALVVVRSRLLDVRRKVVRVRHALWCRQGDTEREAATMEVELAHLAPLDNQSREWPGEVLLRGAALLSAV